MLSLMALNIENLLVIVATIQQEARIVQQQSLVI